MVKLPLKLATFENYFDKRFKMNLFQRAISALKQHGLKRTFLILRSRLGLISSKDVKAKWDLGIMSEIKFWDNYFKTKGSEWADAYNLRFDPNLPLQKRPAALISNELTAVNILDVGAGPLTFLGKKFGDIQLDIIAIDPLADEYDKILEKYNEVPLVRTENLAAEDIKKRFKPNTFDLVYARNCIDHSYNPESAIVDMIDVAKVGSYVLLEHRPNEAENEDWQGLHQWNFSADSNGDFIIGSKHDEVNMTKKYASIGTITCEMLDHDPESDGEWLVTRILKKG